MTIFPFDGAGRRLVYHPESDSLFVVDEAGWLALKRSGGADAELCEDVTGIDIYEQRFKHGA